MGPCPATADGGAPPKPVDQCTEHKTKQLSKTALRRLQNLAVLIAYVCAGTTSPSSAAPVVDADGVVGSSQAAFERSILVGLAHILHRLVSTAVLIDSEVHKAYAEHMTALFARARHKRKVGKKDYEWLISQIHQFPVEVKTMFGVGRRILPTTAATVEETNRTMAWSKRLKEGEEREADCLGLEHTKDGDSVRGLASLTPIHGPRSVVWAAFHLPGFNKHLVKENDRIKPAEDGKVVVIRGDLMRKTVTDIGAEFRDVNNKATAILNRFGNPRIPLVTTSGEELSGGGAQNHCTLLQFETKAAALRCVKAVNASTPATRTAELLQAWTWRSGADAGEIESSKLFTAAGLSPDSTLANSVVTFFPVILHAQRPPSTLHSNTLTLGV
jgi:hypothetical protein